METNNKLIKSEGTHWLSTTQIKSLTQAVDPAIPQLNTLARTEGTKTVEAFIASQIENFLRFVNPKIGMTDEQVIETAELLLSNWPYLRPTELRIFFGNCKMGKYGKIYDRVDGQMLFEWLKLFEIEKDEVISSIRVKENSEFKKDKSSLFCGWQDDKTKSIANAIGIKVEPAKAEPIELNEPTKRFSDEFDKLISDQYEQGVPIKIKLVQYKDKIYDYQQYIECRIKEEI